MTPIPVPIKATNFNPRTPCGVRLACTYNRFGSVEISIHAPLAGCDKGTAGRWRYHRDFNPRTPCGVRLHAMDLAEFAPEISIHAPLAGCDSTDCISSLYDFIFQSTHPLRGATAAPVRPPMPFTISIHAPLAGCDSKIAEIFPANLRKSYKISAKPNKERRCHVLGKGKAAAISDLARCEPPGENRNTSGSHQIMSAPSGA